MIHCKSVPFFIVRLLHLFEVYGVKRYFSDIFAKIFEVSNFISSNNYWSSTTNADNTNNAWIVNFNNGNSNNNNKGNSNYVRCVRGGE